MKFASPPRKIRRVIQRSLLGSFFPQSLVQVVVAHVVVYCVQVTLGNVLHSQCRGDPHGRLQIEELKVDRNTIKLTGCSSSK